MKYELMKLENISLIYHTKINENLAIKDVSFKIYENEFLSLVGPSGCGKSTILSIISGLTKPSKGKIHSNIAKNSIGYMLQKDCLFGWRTIEQNVLLGLEINEKLNNKTKKNTLNILNKYGLGSFLHQYPSQLSGGMRQKAALARTLACNPELLLLDEPFSALDYQTRIIISGEIREIILKEKKTAILVTHDIYEAISLSDRILIFSGCPGEIKEELKLCFEDKHVSVLKRRENPNFNKYFEIIWNKISNKR
ncbi:MAG: ABC transporter ATP-binding protein [Oscillospiraceae bacterium]|jgi:NitT/TauT family transport system ATP-binding protein|nr:ABC transporter ATP-binding protein [Oscillospiraceae bacterium]